MEKSPTPTAMAAGVASLACLSAWGRTSAARQEFWREAGIFCAEVRSLFEQRIAILILGH